LQSSVEHRSFNWFFLLQLRRKQSIKELDHRRIKLLVRHLRLLAQLQEPLPPGFQLGPELLVAVEPAFAVNSDVVPENPVARLIFRRAAGVFGGLPKITTPRRKIQRLA
jgi:hypothetical protein